MLILASANAQINVQLCFISNQKIVYEEKLSNSNSDSNSEYYVLRFLSLWVLYDSQTGSDKGKIPRIGHEASNDPQYLPDAHIIFEGAMKETDSAILNLDSK